MPSDALSRTLVLSVVAVDLVGYSRKSVAEQMSLKDQFNQILLQAIHDISVADRIILDTGDGVAIGFLGDPEDALYVAMYMHDAINRDSSSASGGFDAASIRTGINLGPVKLATGVGGHPNIIGDGINVAERIMQFAEPGQLTASRPLVEVMTRMSDHYATLFQFAGVRTDKQVRAHDVYLVGKSPAAFRQAQSGVLARAGKTVADAHAPAAAVAKAASPAPAAAKPASKPKTTAPATPPPAPSAPVATPSNGLADFLGDRNRVATTAFALVVTAVILAALLAWRKMSAPGMPPAPIAVSTAPAVAVEPPAPATATPTEPAAKVADKAPAQRETVATKPAAPDPKPAAPAVKPESAAATKVATPPVAPPPVAKTVERAPAKAEPVAPPVTRDKPRDAPAEPAARDSARKPAGTKPEARILPGSSAPIVPAYQSPADAPRQEAVAPTPAPPAPAAPAPAESSEVTIVSRSAPAYPVEAVRQGISSGTVRARATIDARGNVVGEVTIIESRPIQAFGREARNSMKNWKFNPGAPGRVYEVEISIKQ